jgi:hypothetical protein
VNGSSPARTPRHTSPDPPAGLAPSFGVPVTQTSHPRPEWPAAATGGEPMPAESALPPGPLDRYRSLIMHRPAAAMLALCRYGVSDEVVRLTLLTEAAARQHDLLFAVVCARRAARLATAESPVDPHRVLPAAAVLADTTTLIADAPAGRLAGGPDALSCATWLLDLAHQFADPWRALHAEILCAVACYQRDECDTATQRLRDLRRQHRYRPGGTAIVDAVTNAETVVAATCAGSRPTGTSPSLLVVQGGLVQPGLDIDAVISRFARHLARHRCPTRRGTQQGTTRRPPRGPATDPGAAGAEQRNWSPR